MRNRQESEPLVSATQRAAWERLWRLLLMPTASEERIEAKETSENDDAARCDERQAPVKN